MTILFGKARIHPQIVTALVSERGVRVHGFAPTFGSKKAQLLRRRPGDGGKRGHECSCSCQVRPCDH